MFITFFTKNYKIEWFEYSGQKTKKLSSISDNLNTVNKVNNILFLFEFIERKSTLSIDLFFIIFVYVYFVQTPDRRFS